MARPLKNNADYFSHDANMRDDPRIKALRRKFGMDGYGIYNMLLEYLTDAEFFNFKRTTLNLELIAGDFGIEPEKLSQILDYCFNLDLLQIDSKTQIVRCKTLDNRFEALLSKRITDRIGVFEVDNTQSKVKESILKKKKEDKSKENETAFAEIWPTFNDFWDLYAKKVGKPKAEKLWKKIIQVEREKIMIHVEDYVRSTPDLVYRKHPATYLGNQSWNDEIVIKNGKPKFDITESAKRIDEILKARGDS